MPRSKILYKPESLGTFSIKTETSPGFFSFTAMATWFHIIKTSMISTFKTKSFQELRWWLCNHCSWPVKIKLRVWCTFKVLGLSGTRLLSLIFSYNLTYKTVLGTFNHSVIITYKEWAIWLVSNHKPMRFLWLLKYIYFKLIRGF